MDFAMRYDRWYRPLATFVGMGPKRTMIRLDGDALHVKHGWMFRIDVPLTYIKSAHLITARPLPGGSTRWEMPGWSTVHATAS